MSTFKFGQNFSGAEDKRSGAWGVRDQQVNVRLIAATHQDIGQLVRQKKFRDDLYFRIAPSRFPFRRFVMN